MGDAQMTPELVARHLLLFNAPDEDHTLEAAQEWLERRAPDLARAYLAEHEARVAAEAAQALMAERAANALGDVTCPAIPPINMSGLQAGAFDKGQQAAVERFKAAIRRLAPEAGVAELAKLRAERDEWKAVSETLSEMWSGEQKRAETAEAEAATLRARLAEAEGKVAALTDITRKAANRLDWCAGLIEVEKARDQATEWADETRAALAAVKEAEHG